MLQYHGDLTFIGTTPASVAARRSAEEQNYELELQVLGEDEEVINHAFVTLSEGACDTFALNEDVYLMATNRAVNVFTMAGNYCVAANMLSVKDQVVPVGVDVRYAGTYTFSMPSTFSGTAILVDNESGARTDLSLSDYEVILPKGMNTTRFTLELKADRGATTAIEQGGALRDGNAHKFIRDGLLYILRDGKVYNAVGQQVK